MTRAELITGFEHVLKSHDQNGAERLSRAEVGAMVGPGDALLRDYAALDVNHDGYLTLAEILRKPLATFTCIDSNGSGSLSASEILERKDRCGPEGVQKAV